MNVLHAPDGPLIHSDTSGAPVDATCNAMPARGHADGRIVAFTHPARIALAVPYRAVHALHARGWTLGPIPAPGAPVDDPGAPVNAMPPARGDRAPAGVRRHGPARICPSRPVSRP